MKALQPFRSPYLLITSFLVIMISGQHLGGFYLLYLVLALPYGGIHALLALVGIMGLVIVHQRLHWRSQSIWRLVGLTAGTLLLVASLITFFYNDKEGYNYGTFEQVVPLVTLTLFALIAFLFVAVNAYYFFKGINSDSRLQADNL
jgi:uncharacterized membrane protein